MKYATDIPKRQLNTEHVVKKKIKISKNSKSKQKALDKKSPKTSGVHPQTAQNNSRLTDFMRNEIYN